jgi:hypothetical protein
MMNEAPNPLLHEIEAFSLRTGVSLSRVAKEAARNGDFINRLRRGGRCWPETEQRVREFMRATDAECVAEALGAVA